MGRCDPQGTQCNTTQAGWALSRRQITDKQWDTIVALHNTAPFKLIRAAAPYFRVRDGEPRSIVNISSTSGLHGNAGQANYALAKAGVTGLTKAIAKEWGPQFAVRANTVAFGHIQTRLTAAKEGGAFVTAPDGSKIALGIPQKQIESRQSYADIPLGRPGTATEAASAGESIASMSCARHLLTCHKSWRSAVLCSAVSHAPRRYPHIVR